MNGGLAIAGLVILAIVAFPVLEAIGFVAYSAVMILWAFLNVFV